MRLSECHRRRGAKRNHDGGSDALKGNYDNEREKGNE